VVCTIFGRTIGMATSSPEATSAANTCRGDEELGNVRMQCVVPRFSETPVSVRRAGPALGQHNEEIFAALGLAEEEIARLRAAETI
jgi:crotonobetainyl-CoA:carnitine CoA-transferase CaiB-like acyl-CoA transferase